MLNATDGANKIVAHRSTYNEYVRALIFPWKPNQSAIKDTNTQRHTHEIKSHNSVYTIVAMLRLNS